MIDTAIKTLRRVVNLAGYEIMQPQFLDQRSLAWHLRTLFADLQVDCVLDVGANTGGYGRFLRDIVEYKGAIVSFEPVRATVEKLRQAVAGDSQWHVCDFALGSEDSEKAIHITEADSMCSFLAPDQSVTDFGTHNRVVDRQTVVVKTLDGVMPELIKAHGFARPYLKMDTQGFDLEVVKGATQTLPGIRALQSEVSIVPIYEQMPDFFTMQQMLAERGFDITGLFPVSRDAHHRVIEFDCVTINRQFCQ